MTDHAKFIAGQGENKAEFEADVATDGEFLVSLTVKGQKVRFPFKDLYSFVFFTATADQQSNLMPIKQIEVKKLVKWHRVQAKKDIQRGEMINVRCETNVETEVYNGLKSMIPKRNPTTAAIPIIQVKK